MLKSLRGNRFALLLAGLLFPATSPIASAGQPASPHGIQIRRSGKAITLSYVQIRMRADLATGKCDFLWGATAALRGAYCAAKLADGTELKATEYARHECAAADITPCHDAFGEGIHLTLHHRDRTRPELRQSFRIYRDKPYLFMDVAVVASTVIASNHVAPLVVDGAATMSSGMELDAGDPLQVLFVPFDNDKFVRYNSHNWSPEASSFEVTAAYDNTTRHGFVLGSVTHDLWKTGIDLRNIEKRRVGGLQVYGGVTGFWSHDTQPHGQVRGTTVTSPRLFLGYFPDYRDGLEAYGRANALIAPPLRWTGGVPFGWNSWAAHKEHIDYSHTVAASDFLKNVLQSHGFGAGNPVYVNLDSYWDFLPEAQLTQAVAHIHANGQKAGVYWSPFTAWGDDFDRFVEGTEQRYRYRDILLKDAAGHPLPKLDDGWPLDPSHPGTLQRIDWQMGRFVRWGFDFVKLDFLSHGALEGAHYDRNVPTGIAAYNLGMKHITDDLAPVRIGRPFFISLSIAPLFPSGYGHSRRISCDAFARIDQTEYMLNALTYGWWANNTLYRYNDPDHTVVYKVYNEAPVSEAEGRSRYNASVIAGTVLLDSDDLTDPVAGARVQALFTNPELNALAQRGQTFRPIEGDTGDRAASLFLLKDAKPGAFYLAVFNYNGQDRMSQQIPLARLGLSATARYRFRDLWTHQVSHVTGTFAVNLEPASSTLLQITPE